VAGNECGNSLPGVEHGPFPGIAFLWFIGVIRDMRDDREDLLFANDIPGWRLAFSYSDFYSGGSSSRIAEFLNPVTTVAETGLFDFNQVILYQIINIYAIRIAGIFMIDTGTTGI
jgi:hypothetical protein